MKVYGQSEQYQAQLIAWSSCVGLSVYKWGILTPLVLVRGFLAFWGRAYTQSVQYHTIMESRVGLTSWTTVLRF